MAKQRKYYVIQNEMKKHKEKQTRIGKLLDISEMSLRNKLDGKTDWTISEIDTLCKHYNMDYYELFKKED